MANDTISLREHIERILREVDLRYSQRFDAQEKAVAAALAAAKEAVGKAEVATEKRLEGVNEFRKSLEDQQNTFVRQDVSNARFKGIEDKIALLVTGDALTKGKGAGLNAAWGYLLGFAGVGIAIAAIYLKN